MGSALEHYYAIVGLFCSCSWTVDDFSIVHFRTTFYAIFTNWGCECAHKTEEGDVDSVDNDIKTMKTINYCIDKRIYGNHGVLVLRSHNYNKHLRSNQHKSPSVTKMLLTSST